MYRTVKHILSWTAMQHQCTLFFLPVLVIFALCKKTSKWTNCTKIEPEAMFGFCNEGLKCNWFMKKLSECNLHLFILWHDPHNVWCYHLKIKKLIIYQWLFRFWVLPFNMLKGIVKNLFRREVLWTVISNSSLTYGYHIEGDWLKKVKTAEVVNA